MSCAQERAGDAGAFCQAMSSGAAGLEGAPTLPELPGRRFLFQPSSSAGGQGPCPAQQAPCRVLAAAPGLRRCLLDCVCWDFGCSLETHEGLGMELVSTDIPGGTGAVGHPGTPLPPPGVLLAPVPWGSAPAHVLPGSRLPRGSPLLLWIVFIYLYGECNKTPAGNGGDSLPFPASQPRAEANKEPHCAAQTCLPAPSRARGRGAKKGPCVSVPAPGPTADARLPAAGGSAAPQDGVSWGRSFTLGGKRGWG